MIKKAKEILAGIDAKLVSEGKIPQVTYIFRAKNFFGMKDQQETVLVPGNPLGEAVDVETLRKRYLEQKEQPLIAESPLEAVEATQTDFNAEDGILVDEKVKVPRNGSDEL